MQLSRRANECQRQNILTQFIWVLSSESTNFCGHLPRIISEWSLFSQIVVLLLTGQFTGLMSVGVTTHKSQ